MDIHALALARERGRDLVAVMAIAQLPIERFARSALRAHGRFAAARQLDVSAAPTYPELVLCVTRQTLEERPATVRATVAALTRGYEEELNDPTTALALMLERVAPSRAPALRAELPRVEEAFTGTSGRVGTLDHAALRRWAQWATRQGITRRPPDVDAAFPGAPGR
jgi:ABC-type nitrate/sulfonate/bicarbonate transport system substrate-binding protein